MSTKQILSLIVSPSVRFSVTKLSIFLPIFGILTLFNSFILYLTLNGLEKRDFARFFYSAVAFLDKENMYGPTPATLISWSEIYSEHLWNLNPPIFHLLLLPLAHFPLDTSFAIWAVFSLIAIYISIRILTQELQVSLTFNQGGIVILCILAFSGTGALLYTGQLSLILLLPFTLAWVNARNGIWGKSGIYLGLLSSIKPFFLIFLPFFIIRKLFPGAFVFMSTFLGMFGIGFLVFGLDAHLEWIRVLREVDWTWSWINASIHGFLRRTLTETPVFLPLITVPNLLTPLYLILGGIVGIVTLFLSTKEVTKSGIDRAFFLLIVAALLISPAGWIYYFFFCMGPLAGLVQAWKILPMGKFLTQKSSILLARNLFFALALPGLLFPLIIVPLISPKPWVTVFLGSIYFWCALALWCGLICDQISQSNFRRSQGNLMKQLGRKLLRPRICNPQGH
jgi:Glycosyltransferase family 87